MTSDTGSSHPTPERRRRLLLWIALAAALAVLWPRLNLGMDQVKSTAMFFLALGVLIYIHELGHFLAAKWAGVRVHEFALGFGPRLWTYSRRGGTDYTIRWLPLGGFVSMKGMDPEEPLEEDSLGAKSRFQRFVVFIAGPLANLLLAVAILCSVRFLVGTEDPSQVLVFQVHRHSEAERMGLRVGDRIVAIDGEPIESRTDLIERVHASAGKPITLTVVRDGRELSLRGTPQPTELGGKVVGLLGFVPGWGMGPRQSLGESIREGLRDVGTFFVLLGEMFRYRELEHVGGVLSIAKAVDTASRLPIFYYVHQLSSLSLSLFVFNLLPIPILDGGHLLLLGIETVRRRRLSLETVRAAQAVGLVIIGSLFILVMYKDLLRWF